MSPLLLFLGSAVTCLAQRAVLSSAGLCECCVIARQEMRGLNDGITDKGGRSAVVQHRRDRVDRTTQSREM